MYDLSKLTNHNIPFSEIEELFTALKSIVHVKNGRPGQRFNLEIENKKMCFILYTGTCMVKRMNDFLVLSTIQGPNIIGLHDIYHEKSDIQVHANTNITYGVITLTDLFYWVDQNNLWKKICHLLMLSTTRFSDYQKENVGISNYELICNLLHSLNNEVFAIRATITAHEYIQTRSNLSRSGIMKTLSILKAGGYIDVNKGLLIKINNLPKKF